jgi:hypothetical protein
MNSGKKKQSEFARKKWRVYSNPLIELTDSGRARPLKGLAGRSPYQTREKPYTIVRNLTDTTQRYYELMDGHTAFNSA